MAISAQKLLGGSTEQKLLGGNTESKAKNTKFLAKVSKSNLSVPKRIKPTKLVEKPKTVSSSKQKNTDLVKLKNLLNSLIKSTNSLKKAAKKDSQDQTKANKDRKKKKGDVQAKKREEKTETKKVKAQVTKKMELPKAPDFFKNIMGMLGRFTLALGIMELMKFMTDTNASDSIFGFLEKHIDKIAIGFLGLMGALFVSSFLPVISMGISLLGMLAPVVTTMASMLLNPIVLGAVGIVLGAITLRQWLYDHFAPQAEKFYDEKVAPFVDEANYGDRADEGAFITKLRDNYGRISTKEDRAKLTDEEKTTQQFLRIYDEKLKALKSAKDNAKPGAFKGSGGSEEVKRLEDELKQMAEQLKIGGKTLAELQAEFEKDGSLPQTSITRSRTPQAQPQTPIMGEAYGTGLKTGPAQYIGGSSEYHVDTKVSQNLSIDETVAMFDQMAKAYEAQGRVIEFSNSAVAGERYTTNMNINAKRDLIERASAAHAPRGGWRSFDYYIPSSGETRFGDSAEGAEIFVPTTEGGSLEYHSGGRYGNFVVILDKDGNVVAKTGHGDTRFGPKSGTVQFSEQKPKDQNVSYQAPYEETGTQIALLEVPVSTPSGGGGGSSRSSSGSSGSGGDVNTYTGDLIVASHYREA